MAQLAGADAGFLTRGGGTGGLGDGSPPAGSRGGAPVGGLGDEVPQKLKQFCIYKDKFCHCVEGHSTAEVIFFWTVESSCLCFKDL